MKYRIVTAIAFALGSMNAIGPAMAADSTQAATATHDFQKLSEQGSQAFQDIDIARLAIFNGHPKVASQLIKRAQLSLIKAEGDGTAFSKAEADLKGSARHTNPAATTNGMVSWLPIGADLSLDKDYSAEPAKAAAVAAANAHLKKGERDKAIETLRLADINLAATLAIIPVKTAVSDVDAAATELADGKFYEANLTLKGIQDSVRYDEVDFNAVPVKNVTQTPKAGLKEPVTDSAPAESRASN